MITPNKFISFKRSIIGKLEYVLSELNSEESISDLYHKCSKHFENIDDFVLALDVLHLLGKVAIDFETGMVKQC